LAVFFLVRKIKTWGDTRS